MSSQSTPREYIQQNMEPSPALSYLLEKTQSADNYTENFDLSFLDSVEVEGSKPDSSNKSNLINSTQKVELPQRKKRQRETEVEKVVSVDGVNETPNFQKYLESFFSVSSNLTKKVKIDEEESEERKDDFYLSADTKVLGDVKIRPFKNETKSMYFVHFMKEAVGNSENSHTHMSVSAFELPDFIEILKKQYLEVIHCRFGKVLDRIRNSSCGQEDDPNSAAFWSKEHTDFLKSESIGVRPYQGADGCYYIRLWMPRRNNATYSNWIGRRMSIRLGYCKQFIGILQEMYADILERIEREAEADAEI
jgi:hypothetical protein